MLLGAVGGPKWSDPNAAVRPEQGLLQLRKALGLFANLRPVVPHPAVLDASPIKAELLRGVDIMVVRELTGGIYFGDKHRTATEASDVCRYSAAEIERVVRLSAQLARTRRRKLTSVDKANVLETSRLWRSVVERMLPAEFPDVSFEHMLVDAAAMHLLAPAARLRRDRHGEHVRRHSHRRGIDAGGIDGAAALRIPGCRRGAEDCSNPSTAPRRTSPGRGIANPYAAILSAAMLLRYCAAARNRGARVGSRGIARDRRGRPARGHRRIAVRRRRTTRAAGDAVVAAL